MLIEQFDAKTDDDRLAACHQISVSGHAEDDPNVPEVTWRRFQAWWRYGFASEPIETWLATDDNQQPTGCYLLWLPERENRQNAIITLNVARACRRQGLGTALIRHAASQAEQAGRTLLMSDTRLALPAPHSRRPAGREQASRKCAGYSTSTPACSPRLPPCVPARSSMPPGIACDLGPG